MATTSDKPAATDAPVAAATDAEGEPSSSNTCGQFPADEVRATYVEK